MRIGTSLTLTNKIGGDTMENYVIAELEIVALAAAETVSASTIVPGDNELPIDPANKNGTTYSLG